MTAALSITELAAEAELAIQRYERACETVRERMEALVAVQQERPRQKLEALVILSRQMHPANPGKPFSVSQAEDVLQMEPGYAAYKVRVAEAEAALREAEDARQVAHLTAQLKIATFKRESGLI